MQQLSNLTLATNQIYSRLVDLGYTEAAQAIVGVPPSPLPETPPVEGPPPEPVVPTAPPEPPIPPAPPEVPPQEPPARPSERYLLAGSSIHIPMMAPMAAFHTLLENWERAKIGSPRRDGVPTDIVPRYAPDATVRGSALDPGMQIPGWAVRDPSGETFVKWATDNGYGKGLSIEVDGLIARPGRDITSGSTQRPQWTPPPSDEGDDS